MSIRLVAAAFALAVTTAVAAGQHTVRQFVDYAKYALPKLSPDGRFIAMGIREAHTTRLVVIDLAARKVTLSTGFGGDTHVADFHWISATRLVFNTATYTGFLDQPLLTGDLYGINYDGTGKATLWGPRVGDGTYGEVLNTLPDRDDEIVIAAYGYGSSSQPPAATAYRIDATQNLERKDAASASHVNKPKRYKLATAPTESATLYADNAGEIRIAAGIDPKTGHDTLFYRDVGARDWKDLSKFVLEDRDARVVGFTEDNSKFGLEINGPTGFDTLQLYDPATGSMTKVLGRDDVDITYYERYLDGEALVAGARYDLALPERQWIREDDPLPRMYKVVGQAFPGMQVSITSMTKDRSKAVVNAWDPSTPGEIYLLDTKTKKVEFLFSLREQLDPEQMGEQRHVQFEARDGLTIHGYLTLPKGRDKGLPLVVLPHGGPHGIRDYYGFDLEAQLLAHHGYAVFQVNFRGSGGYGKQFELSGYRNWGTTMQDDLTDATLWAVEQGIADRKRLCIYGASYGGYAAVMGAVREPELYKCAIGYVGVYDIPLMFKEGDTHRIAVGRRYLKDFHGTDTADQRRRSPANGVDRIKADLFIAAGGQDERVPMGQYQALASALKAAGKPFESMVEPLEGHGFADVENRVEFYSRMLAFLQKNIGGADTSVALPDNPPPAK